MSLLRNTTRAARYGALLAVPMGLMVACTDLSENPTSLITKDTFYKNNDEVLAGVAAVYANLRNQYEDYYALQQVSSEETVVPTRGSDWFDNGAWLELHRQGWTPTSVVGLREVNAIWNQMYTGVARANIVLEALEPTTVNIPNKAVVQAELRALRAMFYLNLLDTYGGVPIATDTKVENRPRKTALETFTFIETELKAARAVLPKTWPNEYGRITQGAADAMLASLYLNAQTYTGTVSATGLAKGTAKWAEALASADLVLNSGTYSLEPNIRTNFSAANQASKENIFVVRAVAADGLGFRRQWQSLHYNSVSPGDGGWNGWAVVAETYRRFDAADDRRKLILIGNQTAISDPTKQVFDRQGNPLVFTIDIADITAANEAEGPRNYKYPVDPAKSGTWNGNDYAIYRLGEIMLIKAEALNELGRTAEAVAVVNTLRARSFSPAKPITASTQADVRNAIFDERLFELYAEGKHRTDQIRRGNYTSGAWFGKAANTPAFKVLLNIPKPQLDVNPLLTQNPGY